MQALNTAAIIATENQEEDFDSGGKRHHWRVLIEATVGQFGESLPQIRQKLVYNGRRYSIRDRTLDAHTLKLVASTVAE
jgi:hypothetical protein